MIGAALLACCASLAAASGGVVVVVPPADAAPAWIEERYEALRAAGFEPVMREARIGVDVPAPAPSSTSPDRDTARAALQEARLRYRELDLDAAAAALDRALDELLRLPHVDDQRELVVDALVLRAALRLPADSDDAVARDALALAVRLEEREALHPGLWPPSVVEAFRRARQEAAHAAPAVVVLRVQGQDDEPAVVTLDGHPIAAGAIGTTIGPHLLSARTSHAARAQIIHVDDTQPLLIAWRLEEPALALQRAALVASLRARPDDDVASAALAEATGATLVVHAAASPRLFVDRHGASLQVDDASAAALARAVVEAIQPTSPTATATTASTTTADPRPGTALPIAMPPDVPAAAAAGDPALWWLVGGGAVVVAAAGLGIAAWQVWPSPLPSPPPRAVVVTCCVQ